MRIDPNDLLLFARVAQTGSFSLAAEQLGLPKSTLSRRLTTLENQLGERLMQRTTRKLVLTELGLRMLDHARQIVVETEAAVALAQYRQEEPSGVLRVSMPNDFANLVLAPVLAEFMHHYPGITLELDLSARRVDIVAESFDVAIRFGDLPDDATLAATPIYEVVHRLYAAPAYLARRGVPNSPADLGDHDLLGLLGRNRHQAEWPLNRDGERWQAALPWRLIANSPELLLRLARQGSGIVSAPMDFALTYVQSGELVGVLPDWALPKVTAWAVFPGRRLMPAKTRVFIDMLKDRLGSSD